MKSIKERLPALLLAAAGVIMMLIGSQRGEVEIIFSKAVRICLECIGIG